LPDSVATGDPIELVTLSCTDSFKITRSTALRGFVPSCELNGGNGDMSYKLNKLKYLASINDDTLPEDTNSDLEIKYIDIGNVSNSGEIGDIATYRFEAAPSRARRKVKDGDVIISTVRTYLQAIAPIETPPENLIVSTGFAVVRPRKNKLSGSFCKYALRTPKFIDEVICRSVGISYPAINATDLGDIDIVEPPLETQTKIADYLDRKTVELDQLIAAKKNLLKLLDEKKRALIAHAVTRGLNPEAPLKDSGIPWLCMIPEHWEVPILKRLLSASDYGISTSVGPEGAIGVLRMGDIQDGEIILRKLGFVDDVDEELMLQKNDLLFNRTNSLDQIGKVGMVRNLPDFPLSFASYLVRFRMKDKVCPEYASLFMNSAYGKMFSRMEALPSIGQANLNPDRYSYLRFPLPPISEQKEILDKLNSQQNHLNKLKSVTEKTINLLQERRTALISAAVTGKLREEVLNAG
jgi:type I restriction enzyme, S subunit